MVTVRRSTNETSYSDYTANSSVALLERNAPNTYEEYKNESIANSDESLEQAKERMQKNLDRILNYEKYEIEQVQDVASSVAVESETEAVATTPLINDSEEDFRPTSTTMQFGDGDIEQMKNEMQRVEKEENASYHLNAKGKLVVCLYALAMVVVMALIIINTGILTRLGNINEAKSQVIEAKLAELEALSEQIESVSSSEYTIDYAENVLGMIK